MTNSQTRNKQTQRALAEIQRKSNVAAGLAGTPDPQVINGPNGLAAVIVPEKYNADDLPMRKR